MTASMSWELDREHEEFRPCVRAFVDHQVRPVVGESEEAGRPPAALLPRDVVEYRGPHGNASAMEDLAGLQAVAQAVAAEAAATA
jgi:hypothetical protein